MPSLTCRDCSEPVSAADLECPHCRALRPAQHDWAGEGYEWKTRATWLGWPLVHVAFGCDAQSRPRVARGLIAVGQRAIGGLAIGIVATGLIGFGVVSFGVCSIGVVSVAAVAAVGLNAFAPVAFGGVAIGIWSGGVAAIGWKIIFSLRG